jgi:hypothetical protein
MAETPLTVKRALDVAIAAHGCDDDYSRRVAVEACASGRAAYWTRHSRHAACACIMLNNLNGGMSFEDALADAYRPHQRDRIEGGLNTLVPLIRAAVNALAKAYIQFTGTWFEDEELAARREPRKAVA